MFAVIKSGGRQYKVSVGQKIEVNRLPVADGERVTFDEVLLISDADRSMIGTPFVSGASVVATAVKQARGEKLVVFRYKPKKRFRHKRGHRQELTILSIDDILSEGKSLITGQEPQAATSQDEGVATNSDADTVAPVDEATGEEGEGGEGGERRIRRRRATNATDATDAAESTEE